MYLYQQKDLIKHLSKLFNVKYRITNEPSSPSVNTKTGTIYIPTRTSRGRSLLKSELISLVLHEISHIRAKKFSKFRIYHTDKSTLSLREVRAIIRTGWRAEMYVDRQAKALMAELYPRMPFVPSYRNTKADKDWYDKNFLNYYRKMLKR